MPVPDLFRDGLARGWKTHNGAALDNDLTLEADVAIIGSGAGGGTTAEILSAAGYKVLLIEEGPLKTSSDFKLLEDEAYASLYQEGIGRMSKDGAIRHESHEPIHDDPRQCDMLTAVDELRPPRLRRRMMRSVLVIRVDEKIQVGNDHVRRVCLEINCSTSS